MLSVLSAGFQTTVQDCGRLGLREFGLAVGGALDSAALRVLNLLVGNEQSLAGLEIVSGRVRLQFPDERLVAWSGGHFEVRVEADTIPRLHCARVVAKETCEIFAKRGRGWFAISGGIDVPQVLGSRSTDLRAGFGGMDGRALHDGDSLPLGQPGGRSKGIARHLSDRVSNWSGPQLLQLPSSRAKPREPAEVALKVLRRDSSTEPALSEVEGSEMTLRIVPGRNWTEEAGSKLLASRFRVAMNSDRMGLRLEGPTIDSINELVSEAVTPGTIQLPRGGQPILLLPDCQTIGGYPKLAHVITIDLARAAQLQPMDELRFELTTIEDAQQLLRQREQDIARFRAGLEARFA